MTGHKTRTTPADKHHLAFPHRFFLCLQHRTRITRPQSPPTSSCLSGCPPVTARTRSPTLYIETNRGGVQQTKGNLGRSDGERWASFRCCISQSEEGRLFSFDTLSATKCLLQVASKVSKFEPEEKAWLQDPDPMQHGCNVIIVSKHQTLGGTWEYTLKYESSGNIVTDEKGCTRFSETLLTRTAPWY